MTREDQPTEVFRGELADIVFLLSLLEAAGIEVVRTGTFYGPPTEICVRRRDEAEARVIVADFYSQRRTGIWGEVVRGPWPTE